MATPAASSTPAVPSTRGAARLLLAAWVLLGSVHAARAAPDLDQAERHVVEQTSRFRREQGAPPVRPSRLLEQAARGFAQFMAGSGQYGHQADGREPVQRTRAAGYDECLVAENIAFQYNSAGFGTQELAEGFFEGWRDSPGHRRNMLDRDATETAVAIAGNAQGRYYAVQLFGRPASQRVRFDIVNRAAQAVRYELDGKPFDLPPRATRTHEQCGQSTLRMQLPGAEPQVLQPGAGEHLRVEQPNGRWRLFRE
jgi:uncharacterized protein YkwD